MAWSEEGFQAISMAFATCIGIPISFDVVACCVLVFQCGGGADKRDLYLVFHLQNQAFRYREYPASGPVVNGQFARSIMVVVNPISSCSDVRGGRAVQSLHSDFQR